MTDQGQAVMEPTPRITQVGQYNVPLPRSRPLVDLSMKQLYRLQGAILTLDHSYKGTGIRPCSGSSAIPKTGMLSAILKRRMLGAVLKIGMLGAILKTGILSAILKRGMLSAILKVHCQVMSGV